MAALVRRTASRHRFATLLALATVASAVAAVATVMTLLVLSGSRAGPAATTDTDGLGGSGGGGQAPAWLMSELESVPLYPGAENQDPIHRAIYTGGDAIAAGYWVKDPPEQVIAFYAREIPKVGWQLETPPTSKTSENGKEPLTFFTANFLKDDLRLTVSAWHNSKDPSHGASILAIGIERR